MKIRGVEKQTGISCTNIRYYEQKELLVPQRANDNNYQVYTSDDIERLKQIKILRMIGIPIAEIKEILDEKKSLKDVMNMRIDQITDEGQNLATVKSLCKTIVNNPFSCNATIYAWKSVNHWFLYDIYEQVCAF